MKNKNTRTTPMVYFSLFIANCEKISHLIVLNVDIEQVTFAIFKLKRQTIFKTRSGISRFML